MKESIQVNLIILILKIGLVSSALCAILGIGLNNPLLWQIGFIILLIFAILSYFLSDEISGEKK